MVIKMLPIYVPPVGVGPEEFERFENAVLTYPQIGTVVLKLFNIEGASNMGGRKSFPHYPASLVIKREMVVKMGGLAVVFQTREPILKFTNPVYIDTIPVEVSDEEKEKYKGLKDSAFCLSPQQRNGIVEWKDIRLEQDIRYVEIKGYYSSFRGLTEEYDWLKEPRREYNARWEEAWRHFSNYARGTVEEKAKSLGYWQGQLDNLVPQLAEELSYRFSGQEAW